MNDTPLITIVIPSYNSAGYIEDTLHSLAAQTISNFEVIVIDDHSTDNTLEVAGRAHQALGLKGQVMLRPAELPKGVASCRNLGVKMANGEWVSFLDSDDLFLPEKISGTAELIKKYGDSCFAYFHGSRQFEDGTNKTLRVRDIKTYDEPQNIFDQLTRENFITTSSVTLKRSLINEIGGFDITLHGIEDYMLWLRISKRSPWYYSAELWTDYRVRTSSLMGGRKLEYYVTQNTNLLKSVRNLKEFTAHDTNAIEYYLFDDVMQYYAMVSLKTGGWKDFLKGLGALRKVGKANLAKKLFKKHFKFLVFKKISYFKTKKINIEL